MSVDQLSAHSTRVRLELLIRAKNKQKEKEREKKKRSYEYRQRQNLKYAFKNLLSYAVERERVTSSRKLKNSDEVYGSKKSKNNSHKNYRSVCVCTRESCDKNV